MPNKNNSEKEIAIAAEDSHSGSSLMLMLVGGLVLIVVGMIGVLAFS